MLNKVTTNLIYVILFLLFLVGGLGDFFIVQIVGFIISGILLALTLFKKDRFEFPTEIFYFIFFISFQLISLTWTKNIFNSISYLVLFTSSLGFLLFFYNFPQKFSTYLVKIIPPIGLVYLLLFIFTEVVKIPFIIKIIPENCCTFFSPYTFEHNHLGDFWAIILIIFTYFLNKGKKAFIMLGLLLSIPIIIISQSRSAVIAVSFTLFYFLVNSNLEKETKKYLNYLLLTLSIIFIIISFDKVTIFSRPYYLQALISIVNHPFGIGMGNFKDVSINSGLGKLLFNKNAAKAHNIIFEITTGLGILSIPFLIWFIKTFSNINKSFKRKETVFPLISILITIIFLFDMCYVIPTAMWLWFSFMGISMQSGIADKKIVK